MALQLDLLDGSPLTIDVSQTLPCAGVPHPDNPRQAGRHQHLPVRTHALHIMGVASQHQWQCITNNL